MSARRFVPALLVLLLAVGSVPAHGQGTATATENPPSPPAPPSDTTSEEPQPPPANPPAATEPAGQAPTGTETGGQTTTGTAPADQSPPSEPGAGAGSVAAEPASGAEAAATDVSGRPTRDSFLPRLDVYFPEGDLDLRVSRLVNKVFFEGQVKYNFVNGDITAFLRYRYYSFHRVTQFTVFDSINFPTVEHFSNDFDRVRGALMLFQWPSNYNHRTFVLTEVDRISSNTVDLRFNNNTTNNYVRFGYQLGTPDDPRSNAIVAETRAERQTLFTAVREIGPNGFGLTAAATYSFNFLGGDYRYVKLEAEALKRFDISANTFLVSRFHLGNFPYKVQVRPAAADLSPLDQFSIPHSEYFSLDGRDNLKGLKRSHAGSDEVHGTLEYFFPWFLDAHRNFLRLEWQNWYWILYSGLGAVGFDHRVYTGSEGYYPDVGVGFESSVRFRKRFRFFISGIVAQTLKGNGGVEARFSVKSYR